MTAAVVADGSLHGLRRILDLAADFIDRHCRPRGSINGLVEVVNVCLMMLGAMDIHRLGINSWFESVFSVRKFWQGEWHLLLLGCVGG